MALKSPYIAYNYGQIYFLKKLKISFFDFFKRW